jgi:hypothetical protein
MQSSSFCTYHKRAVYGRRLFSLFYSTRTPAPFHSGVEANGQCQARRGMTFCLACCTTPKEKALAKRKIRPKNTSNAEQQINQTLIQLEELKRKVRVLKRKLGIRRSVLKHGNGVQGRRSATSIASSHHDWRRTTIDLAGQYILSLSNSKRQEVSQVGSNNQSFSPREERGHKGL